MRFIPQKKPTTGFIVAVTALVVALGGTAVASQQSDAGRAASSGDQAAAPLTKKQVKKIAKKQANKAITQRAPGLTVAKAALADNATNATKAASADLATNAVNAQTAAVAGKVGNLDIKNFSGSVVADGPVAQLFNSNGLILNLSCTAGVIDVLAQATAAEGGRVRWVTVNNVAEVTSAGFSDLNNTAPGTSMLGTVDGFGSAFVQYKSAAGVVTTVNLGFRDDSNLCQAYGSYISG